MKTRWNVPSYKDLLRHDLKDALNYVNAWKPIPQAIQ
ncbi:ORF6C domain-containing protein [Paenibacillus medicaginis]|uniref:ORF6C domain-containing protein n=1 Tax=Paenibacillus medicaginis TaxID=1470560 RepID=A0ABV5C0L8_9BACL